MDKTMQLSTIVAVVGLFSSMFLFNSSYGAIDIPTTILGNPFGHTTSLVQQKELSVTSSSNIIVQKSIETDPMPSKGTVKNDIMIGDSNDNFLYGGDGNDAMQGRDGSDNIYGGKGNDNIQGGTDPDALYGQEGDDLLAGGFEDDYLNAGPGADILYGNPGDDVLEGGTGVDNFNCGDGVDYVVDYKPTEGDTILADCEQTVKAIDSAENLEK